MRQVLIHVLVKLPHAKSHYDTTETFPQQAFFEKLSHLGGLIKKE